ncbi:MAG: HPr family phosphocarrier protein [Pyrinomonadaceae bacterium]
MIEKRVTVTNRLGLHARAAARLVHSANRFQSTMRLQRVDDRVSADAKSILSVLMLAAARGTELSATAEGADEADAIAALAELFSNGFGEAEI